MRRSASITRTITCGLTQTLTPPLGAWYFDPDRRKFLEATGRLQYAGGAGAADVPGAIAIVADDPAEFAGAEEHVPLYSEQDVLMAQLRRMSGERRTRARWSRKRGGNGRRKQDESLEIRRGATPRRDGCGVRRELHDGRSHCDRSRRHNRRNGYRDHERNAAICGNGHGRFGHHRLLANLPARRARRRFSRRTARPIPVRPTWNGANHDEASHWIWHDHANGALHRSARTAVTRIALW